MANMSSGVGIEFQQPEDPVPFQVGTVVFGTTTFVYAILLYFMRKKIAIAIAIIKEASSAIIVMPDIVLFPVFSVGCTVLLVVFYMFINSLIMTLPTITVTDLTSAAAAGLDCSG